MEHQDVQEGTSLRVCFARELQGSLGVAGSRDPGWIQVPFVSVLPAQTPSGAAAALRHF